MKKIILTLLLVLSVNVYSQNVYNINYSCSSTCSGTITCNVGDTLKFYSCNLSLLCGVYINTTLINYGYPNSSTCLLTTHIITGTETQFIIQSSNCGGQMGPCPISVNSTGIKNNSSNDISIFPNPVNEFLNVKTNGKTDVKIFNITGVLMLSKTLSNSSQIDLSGLDKGYYTVQIDNRSYKIFKE